MPFPGCIVPGFVMFKPIAYQGFKINLIPGKPDVQ